MKKKNGAGKHPAAVELGRLGGKAALNKMSKKERSERSRKAARARWGKGKKR